MNLKKTIGNIFNPKNAFSQLARAGGAAGGFMLGGPMGMSLGYELGDKIGGGIEKDGFKGGVKNLFSRGNAPDEASLNEGDAMGPGFQDFLQMLRAKRGGGMNFF